MRALREFTCSDCKETFEKITAQVEGVECPRCGSLKTYQNLNASHFKVNGQGAYSNKMKV